MKWICISKRLPKDDQLIIAYIKSPNAELMDFLEYSSDDKTWYDTSRNDIKDYGWKVTHWMKLPKSPI